MRTPAIQILASPPIPSNGPHLHPGALGLVPADCGGAREDGQHDALYSTARNSPHTCTLAGLVAKRAEIAGQISHTRAALRQLIIDLDHVDAAIRLFDPHYDVEGIRQKLSAAAHRALRGDLTRATLDALRDAPGPTTTIELARHVMAERGLNTAEPALLQLYTRRTGTLLRWQRKRGILRSVKGPQHGRFDLWEIAI